MGIFQLCWSDGVVGLYNVALGPNVSEAATRRRALRAAFQAIGGLAARRQVRLMYFERWRSLTPGIRASTPPAPVGPRTVFYFDVWELPTP